MTSSTSNHCPEWCSNAHSESQIREKDFFHSKPFGTYDDGSLGVIEVGIGQFEGQFGEIEINVPEILMKSSQELREMAGWCLEAADWMDQTLGSEISMVSHGN